MGGKIIKNVNSISIVNESKGTKTNYKPVINKKVNCLKQRGNKKTSKLTQNGGDKSESKALKILKQNNENLEDFDLIFKSLENQFFVRSIAKESLVKIIKNMSLCEVKRDTTIFKQGWIGNYFYIIKEGTVELSINEKVVKKLTNGDYFGELALLHESPRSGSVRALTDVVLYVLERKSFRKILNDINESNFEESKKFIDTINILSNIDNDQKMILIQNLVREVFKEGETVVKEGEIGSCIYIIKEGKVDCVSKGVVIRTLGKGEYFGERCLWIDNIRTMDIITKTKTILFSVSIETLKQMVGEKYREALIFNIIKNAFMKSGFLKNLGGDVIEVIHNNMKLINYEKGQVVLPKGTTMTSKFLLLIEGKLINVRTKDKFTERGNILFEKQIIASSQEKLSDDYIADPDCLLGVCDISVLHESLKENIQKIIDRSTIVESLRKIPLFKTISENKLKSISNNTKIERYTSGSVIITQGETSNKFYIVKSGKVDIFINENFARTINEFDYFGERALFFSEPRSATAKAKGLVETYTLDQSDFKSIIQDGLKNYLEQRLYLQDSVELEDLDYVKNLGAGNYGNVHLVISRRNKCFYALKSVSRLKVDCEELHPYLELEKSILLQIDHPFIVKLVKTLGDSKNIYFLLEFVKGKELWDVIREIGLLNKLQTQFYGCSILLAVNYLHERNFIHRDIKPENILVTESGFIKLIDFGTAKKIVDRTSTIIGSPHYMAPEVILGDGYTFSVDVWSTAVCMYEFLCGVLPFGNDAEDPMDVYVAIVKAELTFPKYVKDKEFLGLMKKMLAKSPLSRLFKFGLLKQHVWFTGYEWDKLINLDIKIPYMIKGRNLEANDAGTCRFVDFVKNEEDYVPAKKKLKNLEKYKNPTYEKWHKDF